MKKWPARGLRARALIITPAVESRRGERVSLPANWRRSWSARMCRRWTAIASLENRYLRTLAGSGRLFLRLIGGVRCRIPPHPTRLESPPLRCANQRVVIETSARSDEALHGRVTYFRANPYVCHAACTFGGGSDDDFVLHMAGADVPLAGVLFAIASKNSGCCLLMSLLASEDPVRHDGRGLSPTIHATDPGAAGVGSNSCCAS
jgi:hypothetical protein